MTVLERLVRGPATPSKIVADTGSEMTHTSWALRKRSLATDLPPPGLCVTRLY